MRLLRSALADPLVHLAVGLRVLWFLIGRIWGD